MANLSQEEINVDLFNEVKRLRAEISLLKQSQNTKLFRHRKTGGLYSIVSIAQMESTLEAVVVYRATKDSTVWVRSYKEFFDGRFEEIT